MTAEGLQGKKLRVPDVGDFASEVRESQQSHRFPAKELNMVLNAVTGESVLGLKLRGCGRIACG